MNLSRCCCYESFSDPCEYCNAATTGAWDEMEIVIAGMADDQCTGALALDGTYIIGRNNAIPCVSDGLIVSAAHKFRFRDIFGTWTCNNVAQFQLHWQIMGPSDGSVVRVDLTQNSGGHAISYRWSYSYTPDELDCFGDLQGFALPDKSRVYTASSPWPGPIQYAYTNAIASCTITTR